ncbi:hypothetical protein GCM10009678_66320 [Actinomadura kijaniata]|uniref:Uncharacterized protein n=1 Tax=Actinomadura namibiensis TaxID=182080 RepID=A0A7W3QRA5_ACTNM|nr:hypothetical protein [Actinomadura namibiensis]MBA8956534.1 hypothetical protein [Actinomadura namibiensis]
MFALFSHLPNLTPWIWQISWVLPLNRNPPPLPKPQPSMTVPNPAPALPPGVNEKVDLLIAWGKGGVMVCGVAGLLYCAGQMVAGRRNRSSLAVDGAVGVPWTLAGFSLAATTASIAAVFLS